MLLECMYPSILCVCMLLNKKSAPELMRVCYIQFILLCVYMRMLSNGNQ